MKEVVQMSEIIETTITNLDNGEIFTYYGQGSIKKLERKLADLHYNWGDCRVEIETRRLDFEEVAE